MSLTRKIFQEFQASYQSLSHPNKKIPEDIEAFVYADDQGICLLTNVLENDDEGGFALSIDHDGWMQVLSTHE